MNIFKSNQRRLVRPLLSVETLSMTSMMAHNFQVSLYNPSFEITSQLLTLWAYICSVVDHWFNSVITVESLWTHLTIPCSYLILVRARLTELWTRRTCLTVVSHGAQVCVRVGYSLAFWTIKAYKEMHR